MAKKESIEEFIKTKSIIAFVSLVIIIVVGMVVYFAFAKNSRIEYRNTQYGFSFILSESWKGYSIIVDKWQGHTNGTQGDVIIEQGPEIMIRHSKWISLNPRQDISIIVFTIAQWDSL